mmetsp:Transcript_10412/g.27559  ORF Transcript_10412/g.27559 Transcript_10412/m.27559 type:complete len:294 (+) Transcript_10412:309-1190(+)
MTLSLAWLIIFPVSANNAAELASSPPVTWTTMRRQAIQAPTVRLKTSFFKCGDRASTGCPLSSPSPEPPGGKSLPMMRECRRLVNDSPARSKTKSTPVQHRGKIVMATVDSHVAGKSTPFVLIPRAIPSFILPSSAPTELSCSGGAATVVPTARPTVVALSTSAGEPSPKAAFTDCVSLATTGATPTSPPTPSSTSPRTLAAGEVLIGAPPEGGEPSPLRPTSARPPFDASDWAFMLSRTTWLNWSKPAPSNSLLQPPGDTSGQSDAPAAANSPPCRLKAEQAENKSLQRNAL